MEHWQLTFAAVDRPTLLSTSEGMLAATRALARVAGPWCPLFCLVDNHGHALVRGDRVRAGRVASALLQSLAPWVDHQLEPARIWPVRNNRHLENLITYICDQTTHHELQLVEHPALWKGSCFQDLVGARILPGFRPELLRQALPRLTEERIWAGVGLSSVGAASDRDLEDAGPAALAAAALAAVGHPAYDGREQPIGHARRVVCRLGRMLGWDAATLGRLIATTPRAARRLAVSPVDPRLVRAARLQIALRATCRLPASRPVPRERWVEGPRLGAR